MTNTKRSRDIVYTVLDTGHRKTYAGFFAKRFLLEPVLGRMTPLIFLRLIFANRLVFATLDDSVFWFTVVAVVRAALLKKTVGMFLRPQKCFDEEKAVYRFKRYFFMLLRLLPSLRLIAVVPFAIDPRLSSVAHAGVTDPQGFDMFERGTVRTPRRSMLAVELLTQARGRHIISFLGAQSRVKGIAILANMMRAYPEFSKYFYVVTAGNIERGCKKFAEQIVENGGCVINRRLSDEELESLYGISNKIWCCYLPEYDQASGVFGRALQWNVPVILRGGSAIQKVAYLYDFPHAAAVFNDAESLYRACIKQFEKSTHQENLKRIMQVSEASATFDAVILSSFGYSSPVIEIATSDVRDHG